MTSPIRLDRFAALCDRWRNPRGLPRPAAAAAIALALAAVGLVVYLTGGTKLAYPHLFYVPILLSAFCFGLPGAVGAALLAGLIAGPWMPLDAAAGTPQPTANWITRAGYFLLSGTLAGLICSLLNTQLAALRWQGFHDSLTGLPNKARLRRELGDALAAEPPPRLALAALQLERFEDINAAFGYRTGDALLAEVARRLRGLLPAGAELYHLYAAHFAVLCREADGPRAAAVVRDLLAGLRAPFLIDALPLTVEGRAGLAAYPDHAADGHALLRAATFALYDAERNDRPAAAYDPLRHDEQRRTLGLLTELRHGLEVDQLELLYQPKVSLTTGACTGVEALVRWRHPAHGVIPPGRFLPAAERTALVGPLTAWVVRAALAQRAAWRAAGLDLPVAVNVSVRNLEDPAFPALLRDLMESYGVAPGGLEVEVTESAVMARVDDVLAALAELKGLGIAVAIDDFGTGQSSLAYLKELAVDVLKIDQGFVRTLLEEPKNRKIVRATIDLAHDMDLRVVAEGVETGAAVEHLRALSCDMAQGYFIARPLAAADLVGWLEGLAPRLRPAPGRAQRRRPRAGRPGPARVGTRAGS